MRQSAEKAQIQEGGRDFSDAALDWTGAAFTKSGGSRTDLWKDQRLLVVPTISSPWERESKNRVGTIINRP